MRVVALVSGGKDSCYNMMCCVEAGHNIVALANLKPQDNDEIDSYMYQTVGHQAIGLYAEAMALPLYRRTIHGSAVVMSQEYVVHPGDEVEDLFELLKEVKEKEQVEAVSVGAIFSDYQRLRVENVVGTRQTPGKECRRYFATSTAEGHNVCACHASCHRNMASISVEKEENMKHSHWTALCLRRKSSLTPVKSLCTLMMHLPPLRTCASCRCILLRNLSTLWSSCPK
uniref:diphthine--ammonia ligase isoform X3 n=1 Tax=Myxine glutinosa TaxID=7769 RepID=UPI00358DEABE